MILVNDHSYLLAVATGAMMQISAVDDLHELEYHAQHQLYSILETADETNAISRLVAFCDPLGRSSQSFQDLQCRPSLSATALIVHNYELPSDRAGEQRHRWLRDQV